MFLALILKERKDKEELRLKQQEEQKKVAESMIAKMHEDSNENDSVEDQKSPPNADGVVSDVATATTGKPKIYLTFHFNLN